MFQKFVVANFDKKLWRILKYGGSKRDEFSFFRDIHITNGWHVHLHKAYRHKNWTTGAFSRVSDFKKTL